MFHRNRVFTKLASPTFFLFCFFMANIAAANHPTEGNISISELIEEALKNNLELKAIEKEMNSAALQVDQTQSLFWPEFSLEGGYAEDKRRFQKTGSTFYSSNVTWNLYRGGKDKYQLSYNQREALFQKINFLKSKYKLEREISKRYYELLYLKESMALKNEALAVNKTQLAMAVKKRKAGLTSEVDVLEFELRSSTLESDINFLVQQKIQVENEVLLFLATTDRRFLKIHGHLQKENTQFSIDELNKKALEERLELKLAEKDRDLAEIKYSFIKSEFFPIVDLEGKYGKLFIEGDEATLRSDNSYLLSLKMTIPLFSGLSTVRSLSTQEQEKLRSDNLLRFRLQETQNQITRLVNQIETIKKRLNIEEKNIERSRRYFEITQNEYKRGIKNSPDLAGASERLFEARIRNLEYRKNYYLAKIELAEILGVTASSLN